MPKLTRATNFSREGRQNAGGVARLAVQVAEAHGRPDEAFERLSFDQRQVLILRLGSATSRTV
jgi:hypothetical protein